MKHTCEWNNPWYQRYSLDFSAEIWMGQPARLTSGAGPRYFGEVLEPDFQVADVCPDAFSTQFHTITAEVQMMPFALSTDSKLTLVLLCNSLAWQSADQNLLLQPAYSVTGHSPLSQRVRCFLLHE